MKILSQGTLFQSQPGTKRQSCTFPGICVTPTGRWICTFRAAPQKAELVGQNVALCWSDDEGSTWSLPSEPFVIPEHQTPTGSLRTGHVTSLSNGKLRCVLSWTDSSQSELPFFNEETEGLLETRIYQSSSTDNGDTWSKLTPIETSPFEVPTPTTGPLLELNGGQLVCQFELNKPYNETSPWEHRSILKFSSDGGITWPEHRIVSEDPEARLYYWDQRPGIVGQNQMLNLFWTYDRQAGQYLNLHARESLDSGKTWSEMWDTGVPGQPAPPVRLKDGAIALVYVDRTEEPVIKLRLSKDEGRSWPEDTELLLSAQPQSRTTTATQSMQDAWAEMFDFALGLPTTTLLPNGDLLVVYYAGPRADETSLHWVRLGMLDK